MPVPIVPAVIPVSKADVLMQADRLAFSREFHLDIVDGVFVPKLSWPIEPAGAALDVKTALDPFTLEVDLMVEQPLIAADEWIVAGADMLVFHIETLTLEQFQAFSQYATVTVGVSSNGETSVDELLRYAAFADYVQVMGIYEIGAQGQPFYKESLRTIETVKNEFPDMMVSVDGSVNADTITALRSAGADRFICGSAIVLADDPQAAQADLQALIT